MKILKIRKRGRPATLNTVRYAKELGVTPGHLSRVMSGERQSPKLVIRLEILIAKDTKTKSNTTTL